MNDYPTIFADSLPNNEVGYVKVVEDSEARTTTNYMCYPGCIGVTLDTPLWMIKRTITHYDETGAVDYYTFDYPNGSTKYAFAPSNATEYTYKFTNL